MYYVYILESISAKKLYIGFTSNFNRRLREHNSGKHGYTSSFIPWKIIYFEAYLNKYDATSRERKLKAKWGKNIIQRQLNHYFNFGSSLMTE
ncbi:MAG: GIY-YIG nuclease family protein [bacterium]|nr:GIY-YIG nuclease family protein [bacterium]